VGSRAWSLDLLRDLGLRTDVLPDVVDAGTDLGPLRSGLLDASAYRHTRVVAPGSHDTASAVVGAPLTDAHSAYISSGTWSLVGIETVETVVTEASRLSNLTNEGGVCGTVRVLRNCSGLWLLQECRRQWIREGEDLTYDDLVRLAASVPGKRHLIDPDLADFVAPGDMPARIRAFCTATGQPAPGSPAEVARCIFDSLVLGYDRCLRDITATTGRPIRNVHVVGGGSRNRLLNQLLADACGLPVTAGPVEATAIGNVLVQLHALGEMTGLADMRAVSLASSQTTEVEPDAGPESDDAYLRFEALDTSSSLGRA
jgi:rhamnulokinase